MAEIKQTSNDSQLHWFWRITTKWWFFPAFYVLAIVVLAIYFNPTIFLSPFYFLSGSILVFFTLPLGLFYYQRGLDIMLSSNYPSLNLKYLILIILILISYISIFIPMILIPYYKLKKNMVLRGLIIVTILLVISSFYGLFHIESRY